MMSDQFTTTQVSRLTGVSVRQLDYWAKSRLLTPSLKQSNGQGTRKIYSFEDLVKLRLILQLRRKGLSIQKIRRALRELDLLSQNPDFSYVALIPDKNTVLAVCKTEEKQHVLLDVLSPNGQQVLWIVLDVLRGDMRKNADGLLNMGSANSQVTDVAV